MEPLLDLPIDQFFGALDELGLDPERRSDLLREYRRRNSAFSPVYGLLDSVADEDVAGALDVPAAAASGLIPREDMVSEALNAAGAIMGLGGLLARPTGSLGTGGRVAPRSGDETPAQQVARLLREGRAPEVTDDLMAQVDPQEMARLYETGATGMDMPLDEASRMARAGEMGFDTGTPLYHGTGYLGQGEDFVAFFDNPQQNRRLRGDSGVFLANDSSAAAEYGDRILSVFRKGASPLEINLGNPKDVFDIIPENKRPYSGSFEDFVFFDGNDAGAISMRDNYPEVFSELLAEGRDIRYRGISEDNFADAVGPQEMFQIADPRNIRSRFARFDPRLSHLANLSAANIDPLTGAAAMGVSQQQQDPLASLRAYLAQNGLLSQ
jgi:hypothetical protein